MAPTPANRVFRNGKIYTVDRRRTWAEAVAVTDGRITYVGDNAGAAGYTGANTELIDLDGQMMLPGFFDCHVHLASGGLQEMECNLVGTRGRDETLAALRNYVAAQDPNAAGWIRGSGWDIGHMTHPEKEWLDEIEPDRPVYLNCNDGHSAWVNSRALELAGITDDTPNPLHGEIHRNPATGEATGWLQDFATSLVKQVMPEPSLEERTAGLEVGIRLAHRFGITSVIEPGLDDQMIGPYLALEGRGELNIRLRAAMSPINWQPGSFDDEIYDFVEQRHQYRRDLIDVDSVKMYIDGAVEYGSAALLEPYLRDDLNRKSEPFYSQEQLNEYVVWLDSRGIQVHIHAIGDRGVRMVLDAYQAARDTNDETDNRHHICHLQMINPADVARFAELNVMATFQPFWAFESAYHHFYRTVLGDDRTERTHYLLGSVHRSGGRLVGGSDWFVTSLNPLDAISVGVRRMDPELGEGAGPILMPSERVDLATMIAAYTINGAYANHRESDLGSIEVGKLADLIVLDRNLFEISAAEIAEAQVQFTLFEGEPVYGRLG